MPRVAMATEDKKGSVLCEINSKLFNRPESYKLHVSSSKVGGDFISAVHCNLSLKFMQMTWKYTQWQLVIGFTHSHG